MRILLLLMAILGFAALTLPANATPLTHAQVQTACGKDYGSSSGGHTGCVKECGDNVCLYDCKGKGKKEDCAGFALLTAGTGGGSHDQPEAYLPPTPGVELVMDFVNFGALQSACGKISGSIFGKTGEKYACANPACDKSGGTCIVVCLAHQCHALMPGKPDGKLTLLAILQGGDTVSHMYAPNEGATTRGSNGAPDAPAAPGAPPPPPPPVIY